MAIRLYFTLIGVFISIQVFSQVKTEFIPRYDFGYHYNVFRTPFEYEDDGIYYGRDSLVSEGFFHRFGIGFNQTFTKKKHTLKWKNNISYKAFHGLPEGNEFNFRTELSHKIKFNNNFSWINTAHWKRFQRDGVDGFSGDFALAINSYRQTFLETDFKFDLWKYNVTHFSVSYRGRKYDDLKVEELSYPEFRYAINSLQFVPLGKKKTKHILRFKFSVRDRNYERVKYDYDPLPDGGEFLDTVITSNRRWVFINQQTSFKYKVNDAFQIRPYLGFEKRNDVTDGKYTHFQTVPGLKFHFKKGKISGTVGGELRIRDYKNLTARQADTTLEEPFLHYNYVYWEGFVKYAMKKGWTLHVQSKYLGRSTNTTAIDRGAYREFNDTVPFSVGISWRGVKEKEAK